MKRHNAMLTDALFLAQVKIKQMIKNYLQTTVIFMQNIKINM